MRDGGIDCFVQIVITRNVPQLDVPTFHITWQDEHQVVKSGDYWGVGIIEETLGKMAVAEPERRFAKA